MFRLSVVVFLLGMSLPLQAKDANKAGDPQVTLNKFYAALKTGDLAKAEGLVITPSEEKRAKRLKAHLKKTSEMMKGGQLVMKARASRVQGKWAVVVSYIKMTRKGQTVRRVRDQFLVVQDGKWKIVPEALRSDPAVKPLRDKDTQALFKWYRENMKKLEKKHGRD